MRIVRFAMSSRGTRPATTSATETTQNSLAFGARRGRGARGEVLAGRRGVVDGHVSGLVDRHDPVRGPGAPGEHQRRAPPHERGLVAGHLLADEQ